MGCEQVRASPTAEELGTAVYHEACQSVASLPLPGIFPAT